MNIEDMRKTLLWWGIAYGEAEITDRLLDAGVKVPDIRGSFYITINGVPACLADRALVGQFNGSVCQHASLHRAIQHRSELKAIFHGAVVAVSVGSCPTAGALLKTA